MRKIFLVSVLVLFFLNYEKVIAQTGSQVFTSSDTFTVPAGVTLITIEVVGAGGKGGFNGGGGGGGGGYALGTYSVAPLSVLNVTVGSPGSGSLSGTTSVGALISASGGSNGTSVANPNLGGGGTGGTATGGTIANRTGGTGGGGYGTYFGGGGGGAAGAVSDGLNGNNTIIWTGQCITPGGSGGTGGGAPGGDGGKGAGFTDPSCNVTNPAGTGNSYGGGGGGGNGNGGTPGTGAGGYCRISWDMATGMDEDKSKTKLQLVQNPFTDKIIIRYAEGTETFELSNSAGQVIWSGKHIEHQDFSGLASGMYLLKIIRQNSTQIIKAMK